MKETWQKMHRNCKRLEVMEDKIEICLPTKEEIHPDSYPSWPEDYQNECTYKRCPLLNGG